MQVNVTKLTGHFTHLLNTFGILIRLISTSIHSLTPCWFLLILINIWVCKIVLYTENYKVLSIPRAGLIRWLDSVLIWLLFTTIFSLSQGVCNFQKNTGCYLLDLRAWELTPPSHIMQFHDPIITYMGRIDHKIRLSSEAVCQSQLMFHPVLNMNLDLKSCKSHRAETWHIFGWLLTHP